MPLGSGLGTFVPIYDMHAPRTLLADRFVNHAHDDWLELWLTGGVPALMLAAAFLAWFLSAVVTCWRPTRPTMPARDILFARAASIAVALLLVHSALDYPLRTLALSVVFALACGLLFPAAEAVRRP
jgi:O-antigen ligase